MPTELTYLTTKGGLSQRPGSAALSSGDSTGSTSGGSGIGTFPTFGLAIPTCGVDAVVDTFDL